MLIHLHRHQEKQTQQLILPTLLKHETAPILWILTEAYRNDKYASGYQPIKTITYSTTKSPITLVLNHKQSKAVCCLSHICHCLVYYIYSKYRNWMCRATKSHPRVSIFQSGKASNNTFIPKGERERNKEGSRIWRVAGARRRRDNTKTRRKEEGGAPMEKMFRYRECGRRLNPSSSPLGDQVSTSGGGIQLRLDKSGCLPRATQPQLEVNEDFLGSSTPLMLLMMQNHVTPHLILAPPSGYGNGP